MSRAHEEQVMRTATEAGEALGFRVPIAADAKKGRSWSGTHYWIGS